MKINEHGYWENSNNEGHGVDPLLARGLSIFFVPFDDKTKVIDVGCGNGYYTHFLNDHGISCTGYDGNPFTNQIAGKDCYVMDFAKPIHLDPVEYVLCLEVGEHIPEEYENMFLYNLVTLTNYALVLSWALPSSGGNGHVNSQENEYIIDKMDKLGMDFNIDDTKLLRTFASLYPQTGWWFKDTLMVFYKRIKYD